MQLVNRIAVTNGAVPVEAWGVTIGNGAAYSFHAIVNARKSDGSEFGSWHLVRQLYNQGAGIQAKNYVTQDVTKDDAAWDAEIVPGISGTQAVIKLTGNAGDIITWRIAVYFI